MEVLVQVVTSTYRPIYDIGVNQIQVIFLSYL